MVYLASYTELTRLSSTNLLIPLRLSSGRIDGTAKRRTVRGGGAVYFAAISSLPLLEGMVRVLVSTLRCFAVAAWFALCEKGSREIGSRPTDCGIGQLSLTFALLRGVLAVIPVTHLSPLSFRFVYFYISFLLATSLSRPFIFQRPLFCTAFFLFSLFLSFFPFPPFAATLALPIFPTPYIVHFLSTSPSPNTVLLPVSSLFSFFLSFFRSFVQPSLFLSVSLSSVPAMGMTMEEMG